MELWLCAIHKLKHWMSKKTEGRDVSGIGNCMGCWTQQTDHILRDSASRQRKAPLWHTLAGTPAMVAGAATGFLYIHT